MINTSIWKEFKIGDLFEKLDLKCRKKDFNKAFDVSLERTEEFNLPLVNAKHDNNGIMYYGRDDEWDSAEMTIDIVGDGAASTGDVYAQPQRTGVLYNAYLVKPLWNCQSEYVLHFMACVIERCIKTHFGYENKCTWDKVKAESVYLPATSDGQPDWGYMESYMKAVMEDSETSLENLKKVNSIKHPIDVSDWGEFQITDLFDMSLPRGDLQVKKVEDGNIPLITPSNFNNGMLRRISDKSPSTLYSKGALTVDMFGNAYYQEEDFYVTAHGHVNVLLPKKNLNLYTGTFIASAIRTMFFDRYGFSEMCTLKMLKSEKIKLPIQHTGEPDWQRMEDYMRKIMGESAQALQNLHILSKVGA